MLPPTRLGDRVEGDAQGGRPGAPGGRTVTVSTRNVRRSQ